MGYHSCMSSAAMPLIRPKMLIETARIGARLYRRERDLPGAIPGLSMAARGRIVARLRDAEWHCEELRRRRSPAYQSGKHVQILSALIAEADRGADRGADRDADQRARQTKASGSAALRPAI
ncbi:MAG: DUF6477 family protein [Alphaproteobacteria bacterium]